MMSVRHEQEFAPGKHELSLSIIYSLNFRWRKIIPAAAVVYDRAIVGSLRISLILRELDSACAPLLQVVIRSHSVRLNRPNI